jgi:hypothetical protein
VPDLWTDARLSFAIGPISLKGTSDGFDLRIARNKRANQQGGVLWLFAPEQRSPEKDIAPPLFTLEVADVTFLFRRLI